MVPRKASKTDPRILEMASQKMAVVSGKGPPDKVFPQVLPALYGSVYTLKLDLKKKGLPTFKVSGLRSRYPDAHIVPREEWTNIVGLPIPEDTASLPRKVPDVPVYIEAWEFGTVAEILHLGPYDQEQPTIERLHRFIQEHGYEIAGMHKEEYLTGPEAKVPKTLIRYPVRKAR